MSTFPSAMENRELCVGAGVVGAVTLAVSLQFGFALPAVPFLIAGVAGAALFLYALRYPVVLVCLLPAFIPLVGFSLFNVGETFGFDGTYLIMTMLVLVFVLRKLGDNVHLEGPLLVMAGALLFGTAASGMAAFSYGEFLGGQYLKSLFHIVFYVLVMSSIVWIEVDEVVIRRLLAVSIGAWVVVCVYGIYQLFARFYGMPFAFLELTSAKQGVHIESVFESYGRISSFFSEPSWLGHYLVKAIIIVTVLLLGSAYVESFKKSRLILAAVLPLLLITLFLSFSVGAIVTGLLIFMVMLIRERRYRRKLIVSALIVTALLITVNLLLVATTQIDLMALIGERLSGLVTGEYVAGESAGQRVIENETAIALWKESPLWGIGSGMSKVATGDLFWITNYYTLLLAEQGVVGLLCFAVFTVVLFSGIMKVIRTTPADSETGVYATVLFYMLLTDYVSLATAGDILTAKCWLDFGLAYAFSATVLRRQEQVVEVSR